MNATQKDVKQNEARLTSAREVRKINTGPIYAVEFHGDYIELKVYSSDAELVKFRTERELINTYTIANGLGEFKWWCVVNNHAAEITEQHFNEDSLEAVSSYDVRDCEQDADLVLAYCLEQIRKDFFV